MLRMPLTSTDLIFLPTTSRSRSRRTTSTSGSSGIAAPHRRSRRGVVVRWSFAFAFGRLLLGSPIALQAQPAPRRACCGLLGLLLGPTLARSVRLAPEQHRGKEPLGVIGTLVMHLIARKLVEPLRGQLLQARLVVITAGTTGRVGDALAQQTHDHGAGGFHPAVEVDGGDDRLHGIGEDRRLGPTTGRVLT